MRSGRLRLIVLVIALGALTATLALGAGSARSVESQIPLQPGTESVLFVGNNWDGTAHIVDPKTFQTLGRLNAVPDLQERLTEIYTDPVRTGYFLAIRELVGEGNDQFVDDMFSSHDGRFVYISRPSLADVVGISLADGRIVWRFPMEGQRSDHMGISPDGTRLLVSDSTANKVHVLNSADGKKVGEFASGDSPHENNYSADGKRIFHASIGLVYTPADQPQMDSTKGERYFQLVDAQTNKILKRLEIGKIMADNGYPDMSSAVRPMAISPDEKTVYMQLSFFHGFVEFDLESEKPKRVAELPKAGDSTWMPREMYLLDSAHHGLSINPEGTKLCAAGTMSDYAAIVNTSDFKFTTVDNIEKPYWSTNSGDGKYCFVSASGADEVVVIDYASGKQVTRFAVGDHPQRMRMGVIRSEFVGRPSLRAIPRVRARLKVLRARREGRRLELRLRIHKRATGRIRASYFAGGMRRRFWIPIPSGAGTWTVSHTLPERQRRARRGTLTLTYAGTHSVAGDAVRMKVGTRR